MEILFLLQTKEIQCNFITKNGNFQVKFCSVKRISTHSLSQITANKMLTIHMTFMSSIWGQKGCAEERNQNKIPSFIKVLENNTY